VRAAPAAIAERFGRLDILVNCAAMVNSTNLKGWVVPFAEQSAEAWRLALEINLTAPFLLTQVCAEMLAASGHGSVINVGSIYGMVGPDMRLYEDTAMGNPAAYGTSKGGLLQLTRWLATVMAPAVRVNMITPGGLWRNQPQAFHQRYVERTPLQRMASEEDFKGATAYLASDLSAYVTGQNLIVDGGWTTW
jgi:NAD(P)-dependent dehydrogenase (short-subunit alcohol dehydrogenase family)